MNFKITTAAINLSICNRYQYCIFFRRSASECILKQSRTSKNIQERALRFEVAKLSRITEEDPISRMTPQPIASVAYPRELSLSVKLLLLLLLSESVILAQMALLVTRSAACLRVVLLKPTFFLTFYSNFLF